MARSMAPSGRVIQVCCDAAQRSHMLATHACMYCVNQARWPACFLMWWCCVVLTRALCSINACTTPHHTTPYHITPHHATPHHTTSHHTTPRPDLYPAFTSTPPSPLARPHLYPALTSTPPSPPPRPHLYPALTSTPPSPLRVVSSE